MQVAIGHSEDPDTQAALKSILKQCEQSLGTEKPNFALLFGSISYDFDLLREKIAEAYPDIKIAGCSTHGEMSNKLGYSESSVVLALFKLNQDFYPFLIKDISQDTRETVKQEISKLADAIKKDATFSLILPDVLHSDVSEAINGIKDVFGENFSIFGGGAAENYTFVKTYQMGTEETATSGMAGVIFTKPMVFSTAEKHGMTPISRKHTVTKAEGNLLIEIDGKPALEVYQSYAGKDTRGVYVHSFAFYDDTNPDKYTIRSAFAMDQEKKTLGFGFKIPEHSQIAIMQTNKEKVLLAAKNCVEEAKASFSGKKIQCALVFSCSLRREILGTSTNEELEIIKNALPENTPIIGCYAYGEIGPFEHQQPTDFYSETAVIGLMGE